MNASLAAGRAGLVLSLLLPCASVLGAEIQIQLDSTTVKLSWPAAVDIPGQGTVLPEYTVRRSADLLHWAPVGGKLRGLNDLSRPALNLTLDRTGPAGFFQVTADLASGAADQTADGGAGVFGYQAKFFEQLNLLGFMPLADFSAANPEPPYLAGITWDPTSALYWYELSTNNALKLNPAELSVFRANGFVVSERLARLSFGAAYYDIFHADLPVFVTADSILHAWHRTYLGILEELEEVHLATLLEQMLTRMAAALPVAWEDYGSGPLRESLLDADYFLTVARSLWASNQVPNSLPVSGQAELVSATLNDINQLQLKQVPLFGTMRYVDFSQFKVRGHYTGSERLTRYFRTMMWCGRLDLRIATYSPNKEDDTRQLGTALVLHHLLQSSGQYQNWAALEKVTRAFVGITDSMTFAQLGELLAAAEIRSPADVPDLNTITNLQICLLTGELGAQAIMGDFFFSPLGPEEVKLPRSFTVTGQKFILDSWVFNQVAFDRVHWPCNEGCAPECGTTNIFGKVARRKPSCVDTAFAVLGNSQLAPVVRLRIENQNGVPFRDGLPYHHNLLAAKYVVDAQDPTAWTDNLYSAWLFALRALSEPTVGAEFPEAMRTRAWAMKTVTTQVASWTELRHDAILYAKPSYSPPVICSYPHGFVEPRPEFWRRMRLLARLAAQAASSLPTLPGPVMIPGRTSAWFPGDPYSAPITCYPEVIRQNQINGLLNFSAQMATLEGIAIKELQQDELSAAEVDFLKSVAEDHGICRMGEQGFTGWYPKLFYRNVFWTADSALGDNNMFDTEQGCAKYDALVTDVHTDLPDPLGTCDPGAVIHQGTGSTHMMVIAVDNGPDRIVYAGPVFSHYEFEVPGLNRLSDEEWKARLAGPSRPATSEWTRSYLVPQ